MVARSGKFLLLIIAIPAFICVAYGAARILSEETGREYVMDVVSDVEAAPLEQIPATREELGRLLFYDGRLSGDGSTACASCHDPNDAFTDSKPLSAGYSRGSLYFRNTPTLINASKMPVYDWDGRFSQGDLATVVRDHIAEAHFMNLDGRLLVERMRQVPEYEQGFIEAFGSEVSYGKALNAVVAYLETLESSEDNPYLSYKAGNQNALSPQAQRGLSLFEGKAGCAGCHSGGILSDGDFHALGVPDSDVIFAEPLRHITFRRFFRTLGVGDFVTMRDDPGLSALTHDEDDRGKFRTPSLLEVGRTAPYMHSGVFATLSDVVEFYNEGGGDSPNKDSALRSLGLTDSEKDDLVAFLQSLASPTSDEDAPDLPAYQPRTLGEN